MSKRKVESDVEYRSTKVASTLSESEHPSLPIEIIMKIISYQTEARDIKNCTELTKSIRHLMLSSPKFFNRFQLVLPSTATVAEVSELLSNFGGNVKALKIKRREVEQKLLTCVLKKVANLEEFTFDTHYMLNRSKVKRSERTFQLPKLKKLTFPNDNFEDFITDGKELHSLESLSIYDHRNDNDEILTDFVVKLDNLKELHLIYYDYKKNPEDFPTRDISQEVNFRLTSFSHSLNFNYVYPINQNLIKFFATQAESLKELSFNGDQVYDIYSIMFRHCKNLETLTVHKSEYSEDSPFFGEPDEHVLDNVKHLSTGDVENRDLEWIYGKLPNLESLKCANLSDIDGTFEKLLELKVFNFYILNVKFPNLRSLTCEHVRDWPEFVKGIPNVEEIIMLRTYFSEFENLVYLDVLKTLKNLKKLQKFEASFYDSSSDPDFKITIDMVGKKAKITSSLMTDFKEAKDIFKEDFKDFEIYFL